MYDSCSVVALLPSFTYIDFHFENIIRILSQLSQQIAHMGSSVIVKLFTILSWHILIGNALWWH